MKIEQGEEAHGISSVMVCTTPFLQIIGKELQRRTVTTLHLDRALAVSLHDEMIRGLEKQVVGARYGAHVWYHVELGYCCCWCHGSHCSSCVSVWYLDDGGFAGRVVEGYVCPVITSSFC